ncbi:hypothetical protein [Deinococcus sp. Leaf326]|uniref:hypothetical protein n=1 Tax=Deinococcus sp. Leaf326 TaxID=1736338 RepID=UPI0006F8188C|nr:hypothetical protein [Deinococcus sp. Leaf326]KQR33069.1 hypothetical protein ASF71_17000 [Deinococcus sp. Leaf326]
MTLVQAVEDLYAAFASVPRPTHIRHQPYELQPGEVRQLLSVPLRELSPGLMRSYLFDAIDHVGTWEDFRYFLPRLLELLPPWETEPEPVAWRLKYAHEQGFPLSEAQRAALHAFALAYWGDMVPGFILWARMYLDWTTLEPFGVTRSELLALWRAHPQGALALAGVLLTAPCPPEWSRAELMGWLEEACLAATDADEAQSLSDALLILEHLPQSPGG